MRAIRRINNNVAVCIGSDGSELIAMGKGIGFGEMPRELSLSQVERTFYEVDSYIVSGIANVSDDVFSFSTELADKARETLPHELSPNLPFTLADHIEFALKRTREGIKVKMPLSYDLELNFPNEYRLAKHAVRAINKRFGVNLAPDEASGIAMNFVNARVSGAGKVEQETARRDEEMLEDITEIVEDALSMTVDRASFSYARFATHLSYLFGRIRSGESMAPLGEGALSSLSERLPSERVTCVERIAEHLASEWNVRLSEDERVYLLIHVSRIS